MRPNMSLNNKCIILLNKINWNREYKIKEIATFSHMPLD